MTKEHDEHEETAELTIDQLESVVGGGNINLLSLYTDDKCVQDIPIGLDDSNQKTVYDIVYAYRKNDIKQ